MTRDPGSRASGAGAAYLETRVCIGAGHISTYRTQS
jgi:hypothetical protein